ARFSACDSRTLCPVILVPTVTEVYSTTASSASTMSVSSAITSATPRSPLLRDTVGLLTDEHDQQAARRSRLHGCGEVGEVRRRGEYGLDAVVEVVHRQR